MALYLTYHLPLDVWVGDTVTHLILEGSGLIRTWPSFCPCVMTHPQALPFATCFTACFEGTQRDSCICCPLGLGEVLTDWSIRSGWTQVRSLKKTPGSTTLNSNDTSPGFLMAGDTPHLAQFKPFGLFCM